MKQLLSMLLCMLMLVAPALALEPADGEYTGEAVGFSEQIPIRVTLTFEGGLLVGASATGEGEHLDYATRALEDLPLQMVAKGSIEVDSITGVTWTCRGILAAARDAYSQATQAGAAQSALGLPQRYTYAYAIEGFRWGEALNTVLEQKGEPKAQQTLEDGRLALQYEATLLERKLNLSLIFQQERLVGAQYIGLSPHDFAAFAAAITRKYGPPLLLETGDAPRLLQVSGNTFIRLAQAEDGLMLVYEPYLQVPGEEQGLSH